MDVIEGGRRWRVHCISGKTGPQQKRFMGIHRWRRCSLDGNRSRPRQTAIKYKQDRAGTQRQRDPVCNCCFFAWPLQFTGPKLRSAGSSPAVPNP